MYASASTWIFNVVRQTCLADPALPVQTDFVSEKIDLSTLENSAARHVLKSHEIANEAVIAELAKLTSRFIITIRDPRDAVTSLMVYHHYEFGRALTHVQKAARLCVRFAGDERAMILTYESNFFDDPGTLDRIAGHLGLCLTGSDRDRIFASNRRSEVEKHIAGLDCLPGALRERNSGDLLDPVTHWHSYHAGRDGEIGRWKRILTTEQVRDVQLCLADYFQFSSGI